MYVQQTFAKLSVYKYFFRAVRVHGLTLEMCCRNNSNNNRLKRNNNV